MALVVFVGGWVVQVSELRNIVPGTVGMKALAAIGIASAACAILLQVSPGSRRSRLLAHALAAVTMGLGVAVLAEWILGVDLGLDELLFRDEQGHAARYPHPGRFAPTTAACFVLLGAALLLLDTRTRRRWRFSELLVLPAGVMGTMTVVGYLYEIPSFYGPSSAAKMALNTGACMVALSIGTLLARPNGHLVRLAVTDDPGGILIRRLVPVAVLLPLLFGWLRLRGDAAGLFGERVGMWWLTLATIVAFVALVLRVAGRLSHYAQERQRLEDELFKLANRDPLTGVCNRRRLDEELATAAAQVVERGVPCCVVAVDFDHMKAVNDELGHPAGDALLRAIAEALVERVRGGDVVGRTGGDEFTLLLPATAAPEALMLAEALCRAARDCTVPTPRGEARTTLSIGVAELSPDAVDPVAAVAAADEALYASKRAGGDQARVARAVPLGELVAV